MRSKRVEVSRAIPWLILVAALMLGGCGTAGDGRGGWYGAPADGSTVDGASADVEAPCPGAQLRCAGVCVETQTNAAHCGACGRMCPTDRACVQGACVVVCPTGQTACGGACADVTSDPRHCGGCGQACAAGGACVNGACSGRCDPPRATCDGACVNLTSDMANCGACGRACPSGRACVESRCQSVCAPGQTDCGGRCSDLASDPANCGACGNACAAGQACVGGSCGLACGSGQTECGGRCADVSADPANCGACGMRCGAGQTCSGGACRAMASSVSVTWTFPGLWRRPTGETWLPTYLLHLFGLTPPASGPYQLDTACARITNSGASPVTVTLLARAPGYASDRSFDQPVAAGGTASRCINPAWDLPRLYALRTLTPVGIEVFARDAAGAMISSAMRSVSALPGSAVVWDQTSRDGLTSTARDQFAQMGPYATVFSTPNDPTVLTVRRGAEPRSQYGGFGVIAWDSSRQRYRADNLFRSRTIAVGEHYWESVYLEGGEILAWALSTVSGGSDADIDVYLFTESQYGPWAAGTSTTATSAWRDQRSGASGSFVAPPGGGWYRIVMFNTNDNFVSRAVQWGRTSSRADVAWDALAAIFAELRSRGMLYRNISSSYFEGYQPFSLPRDSIAMRAANCFDGTVLFASILEGIGFEPVLHLTQGHAYVGVRSAPQSSGLGRVWYIETTMVGDTSRTAFDAILCGEASCVVPRSPFNVDVPVLAARAARIRSISY